MAELSGIGKLDRSRLATVLRNSKGSTSTQDAAESLGVSSTDAAKMLARWARRGWLARVRRGIYVRVPFESSTADVALEDSWVIAERLYSPCYIGGWSAAEYWNLTEQIFRSVAVMTGRKFRSVTASVKGTKFALRKVPNKAMFGLKPVWRGQVKVSVSDPTRTVVDMLNYPALGGGIRSVGDIFSAYLKSKSKDTSLLIEYSKRLGNGAVIKRLGFLLERLAPDEEAAIAACRSKLSQGNAKLDPSLPSKRLLRRWRLWIPKNWADKKPVEVD